MTGLRGSTRKSRLPHRHDDRIGELERELFRLRAERRSELCAQLNRDPQKRRKSGKARARAWKDPALRAAHCAALSAAWTPERRAAQSARMRAMREDKAKAREMLERQIAAQRRPEYRAKAAAKSSAVWAAKREARAAVPALVDSVEAAIFGGGA